MKLKMLKGLPASGKSTVAREHVKNGWFRVNRDDLRAMMYPGATWSGKKEDSVRKSERAIVKALLADKQSVVVDDTNLSEGHLSMWKNVALETGATFEVQFVNTPIEECIRRDSERLGKSNVGESVIWKMATENGLFEWTDAPIVVVDVDGTLANGDHRQKYLSDKTNPDRWKKYFDNVWGDMPYGFVARWVRELSRGYRIVIVSGRPDNYILTDYDDEDRHWTMALETSDFVRRICGIQYHSLFMRAQGDKRPDTDIKRDILTKNLKGANIAFVLDDRPRVCEMWRAAGLKVYPVRGACEDF
jgi:predicted kinase